MALSNYSDLKDAVRRFSKRADVKDAFIDDFIALAEEEIYSNDVAPLRIKEMDTRATATAVITTRFLALPDDFLEMRRFKINAQTATVPGFANDVDIKFRAPDQLLLSDITGPPGFFSVTSQLEFERIPDRAYSLDMQYYKKMTGLSDANTTNDILTNYPSIYLNGCLWQLWDYYSEQELADRYQGKMLGAIKGANKLSNKSRWGNAPQIKRERNGP